MNAQTLLARSMSERELQDNVIALAKALGYLVHAERPAMKKDGQWVTPVQGDKGFPDLVLVRNGRILLVELKSEKGKLTDGQILWQGHCIGWVNNYSDRTRVYTWRPSDWFSGTIEEVLK